MREIKFRAWAYYPCVHLNPSENGMFWTGDTLMFDVQTFYLSKVKVRGVARTKYDISNSGSVDIDKENIIAIQQYTGLHDKNGKEIYEGDVLHGREEGDGETTAWTDVYFQIIYDEKLASFMTHEIGIKDSSWDEQICELAGYEVIGNIHENPELLNAY